VTPSCPPGYATASLLIYAAARDLQTRTRQHFRTDFTDYLTVHRLSLLNGFTFFSVFFSNFSFQNLFPLQLFFSSSLLSTPIFPIIFFSFGESYRGFSFLFFSFSFLADRTIGRAFATACRLSVCL